jgi:hypothetical protein
MMNAPLETVLEEAIERHIVSEVQAIARKEAKRALIAHEGALSAIVRAVVASAVSEILDQSRRADDVRTRR